MNNRFLVADLSERVSVEAYYADMGETDTTLVGKIGYVDMALAVFTPSLSLRARNIGYPPLSAPDLGKMKNDTGLTVFSILGIQCPDTAPRGDFCP